MEAEWGRGAGWGWAGWGLLLIQYVQIDVVYTLEARREREISKMRQTYGDLRSRRVLTAPIRVMGPGCLYCTIRMNPELECLNLWMDRISVFVPWHRLDWSRVRIVIFSGAGDILTVNIGANVKLLLFVCFSFCYLNVVGCLEQCSSLITVFLWWETRTNFVFKWRVQNGIFYEE